MAPKAVLFDLWGTLADGPPSFVDDALRRAFAAAKVDVPFERARAAWADGPQPTGPADVEERFRASLVALGKPRRAAREGARAAGERFTQELGAAARLAPDALGAIRGLPPGTRVGVVSNFPDAAVFARTLARLGLSGLLDAGVCSAEAGARKPDPAPFLLALDRCDVYPSEAVMVGDGEDDVAGARAVGMRAVFLARRGEPPPPGADAVVAGLDALPAALARLGP